MKIAKLCSIFIVLLFFSCITRSNNTSLLPNEALIKGYDISKTEILYQFYEEFGFTDVCTHTRSYFRINSLEINSDWHRLPITQEDLLKLKSIPNKIDTVKGVNISVIYNYKNYFSDISLDSKEYIKDTVFEKRMNLTNGYYKINKNTFEIYNNENNTIYYEEHYCN